MSTEAAAPIGDNVNVVVSTSSNGASPSKKKAKKLPKRIQKAEREKLKRDQLNSHFVALADALELTEANNGKASIVCETIRFLKHYLGQIEDLQKANAGLLSESHFVTLERDELIEENSVLEAEIRQLRSEHEAKFVQPNADLHNGPTEFHHGGVTTYLQGDYFKPADVESGQPEAPTVFILPVHPQLHAYPMPDPTQIATEHMALVGKPQARYPSPADSWHFQLLKTNPEAGKELTLDGRPYQLETIH